MNEDQTGLAFERLAPGLLIPAPPESPYQGLVPLIWAIFEAGYGALGVAVFPNRWTLPLQLRLPHPLMPCGRWVTRTLKDFALFSGEDHMSIDTSGGNPNMDYSEHTRTYNGFLRLVMMLIVFMVTLLLGMKFFLV